MGMAVPGGLAGCLLWEAVGHDVRLLRSRVMVLVLFREVSLSTAYVVDHQGTESRQDEDLIQFRRYVFCAQYELGTGRKYILSVCPAVEVGSDGSPVEGRKRGEWRWI